jgi:hypothetical protein
VQRLDGIYVANQVFYDCKVQPTNGISNDFSQYGDCRTQLKVNGAIIAGDTRFQRTYGSENVYDGTPAEIVSYPSAVWLQEYGHKTKLDSGLKVTLMREMAPRV